MDILNQQVENTPSLDMVCNNCIANVQHSYRQTMRLYENLTRQVWENPYYSSAEIISGLGTKAADVLTVQEKLAQSLNGLVSGCVSCHQDSYTKNEDGTVTLN
jgi:hypothetical protein